MTKNLGQRRQCSGCGKAFYDLNRFPVLCPACGKPHEAFSELTSEEALDPPPSPEEGPEWLQDPFELEEEEVLDEDLDDEDDTLSDDDLPPLP